MGRVIQGSLLGLSPGLVHRGDAIEFGAEKEFRLAGLGPGQKLADVVLSEPLDQTLLPADTRAQEDFGALDDRMLEQQRKTGPPRPLPLREGRNRS